MTRALPAIFTPEKPDPYTDYRDAGAVIVSTTIVA